MKAMAVGNPEILSDTPVLAGTCAPGKNPTDDGGRGPTGDQSLGDVPSVQARQVEIYRRMTPSQRLAQAMSMNRQMRALMDSGLRATQPQLTPAERRREIARRIRHARG